MHAVELLTIAGILAAAFACQWIAWRVKLPPILFLLLGGILAGPVFRVLNPDALFGDLLFPFISLAVAIILFEGSLTLCFRELSGLERIIRNMITVGAVVTMTVAAVAVRLLLGFAWDVAFLFGALVSVTGPTVVVPLLRSVRPTSNLSNILRWEGILIDPIGATLALLVFQFIVAGGMRGGVSGMVTVFGTILLVGGALGAAAGQAFASVLRRHWIPYSLQNLAALALVCAVFAVSDRLQPESGLLSVTVMGIWLANARDVEVDDILNFKEHLSVLLISMLFILLAARVRFDAGVLPLWPALGVFAVIQFLARPLSAHVSALGSKLAWPERHFLAWIAPRGIVAAAISAVFAIRLETLGYAEAAQLVPLTFLVIVGTVLLQSATARSLARWLGVAEPEPKGFLIVGADPASRAIAASLRENGLAVQLTDQNWNNVVAARMEGLPAYWGNPASEHAERHLSLIGMGRLLALGPNNELNALAARYYRMEFGGDNVYTVRAARPDESGDAAKTSFRLAGRPLFGEGVTRAVLADLLENGAELKTTPLTEVFSFKDYMDQCGEHRIPLFAIRPSGRVEVFTAKNEFTPGPDWRIIGATDCVPLPAASRPAPRH